MTPCSGESGGQERLRALEASNSFLIPLDRRREWYRYHPLFREFLLGELRRVEPEVVDKLHLRAADWYQANGSPAMALEHLLDTAERDRCVQLVTQLVLPTYSAGQISTVAAVARGARRPAIEAYPPLAVLAGWVGVLSGQTARGRTLGGRGRRGDVRPGAAGRYGIVRLRAGHAARRHVRRRAGADDGATPTSRWPRSRRGARGATQRSCCPAEAHLLAGDVEQARVPCSPRASPVGHELGNTDTVVDGESELALLAMDQGRWDEAADRVARALAIVDEHRLHDYAISVLVFAAAARLAVHQRRPGGGGSTADPGDAGASRRARSCFPFLAVRGRLQLAKVYSARGDHAAARHLLREIDDILRHRPDLGVLVEEVREFRGRSSRPRRIAATGATPLTPAELRLLPYLQTHLTIARDRGATVRLAQHRELGGRLDLPQAGRLLAQRGGGAGDRRSVCSAADRTQPVDSWSSASMS